MGETFTPGPWTVALNSNDIPCIVQGPTQRIAAAYFDGRDGSAWSKQIAAANAALIAAAPTMYGSLDPDTLDAIADEIAGDHHHSARAASLRGIAKRQRAAAASALGLVSPQAVSENGNVQGVK